MVDIDTAKVGLEALSVAVVAIIEDAHDLAALAAPADALERDQRINELRTAGEDVSAIAAAMGVLSRRSQQVGL